MTRAQFWTGIVILMSPLAGFVLAGRDWLLVPCPSVDGRIMYQGRPLSGGWICLAPYDSEFSSDMIGPIDRDGHFACCPVWWKAGADRTRFRIFIYPDPRPPRCEACPAGPRGAQPPQAASDGPDGDQGSSPKPRVVLASSRPQAPITMVQDPRTGELMTLRNAGSRRLEVSLGSEPVFLAIDLKD